MSAAHEDYPLTGSDALLLGAYLIAQEVADREPAGETFRRMQTALSCLADELREVAPEFFLIGVEPELNSLVDSWSREDAVKLLIELRVANPFAPYEFEMTKKRDLARLAEMRKMARVALGLPAEVADEVSAAWTVVLKAENRATLRRRMSEPKSWATLVGVGLAVAGVAVIAGPAIAPLMPAAAGLSGAAATSAGLAQLGFGAVAAGGLGMAGGLWVLGVGGAALGAAGATTAVLLSRPGGAALVGAEIRKLLVSAVLAVKGELAVPLSDISDALERMADEVQDVLDTEERRNERGSDRIESIIDLKRHIEFASSYVERLTYSPTD